MSVTAYSVKAITPNDSTNIPDGPCNAIWVGVGGNISLMATSDGSATLLKNVPSGFLLLVETKRVLATNTTATDLVALYA